MRLSNSVLNPFILLVSVTMLVTELHNLCGKDILSFCLFDPFPYHFTRLPMHFLYYEKWQIPFFAFSRPFTILQTSIITYLICLISKLKSLCSLSLNISHSCSLIILAPLLCDSCSSNIPCFQWERPEVGEHSRCGHARVLVFPWHLQVY